MGQKHIKPVNMANKVILITGGNSGIGLETTKALAKMNNPTIVIASRNTKKSNQILNEIKQTTMNENLFAMRMDLANMNSIRQFARDFKSKFGNLNVLINNAGVHYSQQKKTKEGIEYLFGVNYLGHFLLTNLLLDLLKKEKGRIIHVSSIAHKKGIIDFENLKLEKNPKIGTSQLFCNSKLATLIFSNELQRRLDGTGITSNALHPGLADTPIYSSFPEKSKRKLKLLKTLRVMKSPEEAAYTSIWLATDPNLEGVGGKFFSKGNLSTPANPFAEDLIIAERLWKVSEELCNL